MDANKDFELADKNYQQLKNKMESEIRIFTDKLENLKKEIEGLKASKFRIFVDLEINRIFIVFQFTNPF